MENNQYKKYEDRLKKQCTIKAIASALSIISVLLIIFVPFFRFKADMGELELSIMDFSILDILKDIFSSDIGRSILGLFQIISLVFFVIGIVMNMIDAVKNIMYIAKPNDYALQTYDELKNRREEKTAKKWTKTLSSTQAFYIAISYEIGCLVILKIIESYEGSNINFGLLGLVNGVNAWLILPIVFIAAAIALTAISNSMKKKVKLDILKEDYHVQEAAPIPESDK